MLNRIYIVIGMLAIIVLASAFIAPHFIRWSDYRGRMEELATGMLGTPVTVRGDIEFSLLPQPRLRFSNVLVGSPEEPAATVDSVEAEFSLMDFLRDNYTVTRLVLQQPVLDFTIDESGFLGSGVTLAEGTGGVGLDQASIEGATVRLMDRRSGQTFTLDGLTGALRLGGFSGPFSFQGSGEYQDEAYNLRFNSGALDAKGVSQMALFVQPQSTAFSMSAEGVFTPGMAPKFDGALIYRSKPPTAAAAEDIRGDLVLESKMTASTDRVVLSGYTLQPDENRAGTRLTGAASIQLGDALSFDAVISGGVFSLPPRDAKEDTTTLPYEAVRLLSELPAPIIPPIAGRVGIDLAEVGLRGFSLRNVRVDASTDGTAWTVEQFVGDLPGSTELRASGELKNENERPAFAGDLMVTSERLDGLAALWRNPGSDNPLFGEPGTLEGRVMLAGDALGMVGGVLSVADQPHAIELRLGFGAEKRLDLVAQFGDLSAKGSAIVGALIPNIAANPAFGVSFPVGSFSLSATTAQLLGYAGTELAGEGQWSGTEVSFSRLSAEDWGGIGLNAVLSLAGTDAEPDVSGSGTLRIGAGDAPALQGAFDLLELPQGWRDVAALSAPVELIVDIGEKIDGAQTVTLGGSLGAGALNLRADLEAGLGGLSTAPLRVIGALESLDIAALGRQLGLGDVALFSDDGSMLVSFGMEGSPGGEVQGSVAASVGEESVSFAGTLRGLANGDIAGNGQLDVSLGDASGLTALLAGRTIALPGVSGEAQLHFEGRRLLRLTDIVGTSGESGVTGQLSMSRTGPTSAIAGEVSVDQISVEGLAAILFGRAALVDGDNVWPEGPIISGEASRPSRGTVGVTAGAVLAGGDQRLGAASFELTWDESRLRIARFDAVAGSGRVGLDIGACCAGPLTNKTVSGRVTLAGVPLGMVAPEAVAAALNGVIDGGVRFEGTGSSLAEVVAAASGEGNFTLTDFSAEKLSPDVFTTVAGLPDVLEMEPDALATIMGLALGQGAFSAPTATGAFTIAGGMVRLANLIIEGDGGRTSGSLNLALPTLELGGNFTLTPLGFEDASGLVQADTSRIMLRLAGTLISPAVTVDLEEMIGAILVRANEIEVERLEVLRAEDAERQRAAAEERNRLIAEQRRRAAEEAARVAAEEAARLEAEEEARRLEQERLLQQQQISPPVQPVPGTLPQGPLDLGLPPPSVNQPIGTGVNRPFQ